MVIEMPPTKQEYCLFCVEFNASFTYNYLHCTSGLTDNCTAQHN